MESSRASDAAQTIRRAFDAGRAVWGDDWRPTRAAMAPGRIEILGNHVDYNGGPVLAAAIDKATVVLSDDSDTLQLAFADFPSLGSTDIDPDKVEQLRSPLGAPAPHDFVLGVLERGRSRGRPARRGRIAVATSIPIGSGMSSSAALCVALSLTLNEEPPAGAQLVYDAQAAENWTGVPCGTMDQAASVFGQVILYDGPEGTRSVAPSLGDYCFVVVDSRVDRTLGASAYPIRVQEAAEAARILQAQWKRPVPNLGSLSQEDLDRIEMSGDDLLSPTLRARARHVVTEIQRVSAGMDAMDAGDWERFGTLMNASGKSSAEDYDVSHPRVEALVATMREVPGVAGARMMGGGGGGSALALLRVDSLDRLRRQLTAFFDDESVMDAVVPLSFAPGARLMSFDELGVLRPHS